MGIIFNLVLITIFFWREEVTVISSQSLHVRLSSVKLIREEGPMYWNIAKVFVSFVSRVQKPVKLNGVQPLSIL